MRIQHKQHNLFITHVERSEWDDGFVVHELPWTSTYYSVCHWERAPLVRIRHKTRLAYRWAYRILNDEAYGWSKDGILFGEVMLYAQDRKSVV